MMRKCDTLSNVSEYAAISPPKKIQTPLRSTVCVKGRREENGMEVKRESFIRAPPDGPLDKAADINYRRY